MVIQWRVLLTVHSGVHWHATQQHVPVHNGVCQYRAVYSTQQSMCTCLHSSGRSKSRYGNSVDMCIDRCNTHMHKHWYSPALTGFDFNDFHKVMLLTPTLDGAAIGEPNTITIVGAAMHDRTCNRCSMHAAWMKHTCSTDTDWRGGSTAKHDRGGCGPDELWGLPL